MNLDLACIFVVVLAAIGGTFSGALAQLGRLAAVAAGWAGARALGPRAAPLLQGKVPAFAAHPMASMAAFLASTIVAAVAVRIAMGWTPLRRSRGGGADRAIGALFAGAKAALVLWVALSALAVWGNPIRLGALALDPRGSDLVDLAREYSALGRIGSPPGASVTGSGASTR